MVCFAEGCEMALACDMIVGNERWAGDKNDTGM